MKTPIIYRYQLFIINQIGRDDGQIKKQALETTSKR